MKKYIIDIYGADKGYSTVIDGALEALAQFSDIHIVLCDLRMESQKHLPSVTMMAQTRISVW